MLAYNGRYKGIYIYTFRGDQVYDEYEYDYAAQLALAPSRLNVQFSIESGAYSHVTKCATEVIQS